MSMFFDLMAGMSMIMRSVFTRMLMLMFMS